MSITRWLAIATVTFTPITFAAQDRPHSGDPNDPNAAATPFAYESTFASYRAAPETDETPNKAWRAANDEMGRLGGHAGHIKNSVSSAPAASMNPSRPASNDTPDQPKAMSADHSGHGMHH